MADDTDRIIAEIPEPEPVPARGPLRHIGRADEVPRVATRIEFHIFHIRHDDAETRLNALLRDGWALHPMAAPGPHGWLFSGVRYLDKNDKPVGLDISGLLEQHARVGLRY